MKVIKKTFLIRGTNEEVRAYIPNLKKILDQASEGLEEKNQIAGIEVARDIDGTIVHFLVIKEFESDEEKRSFMEKLSKAKK